MTNINHVLIPADVALAANWKLLGEKRDYKNLLEREKVEEYLQSVCRQGGERVEHVSMPIDVAYAAYNRILKVENKSN